MTRSKIFENFHENCVKNPLKSVFNLVLNQKFSRLRRYFLLKAPQAIFCYIRDYTVRNCLFERRRRRKKSRYIYWVTIREFALAKGAAGEKNDVYWTLIRGFAIVKGATGEKISKKSGPRCVLIVNIFQASINSGVFLLFSKNPQ